MTTDPSTRIDHPLTDFVARLFATDKDVAAIGGIDYIDLVVHSCRGLRRNPNRTDRARAKETIAKMVEDGWLERTPDRFESYRATERLWRRANALLAADKMFEAQS